MESTENFDYGKVMEMEVTYTLAPLLTIQIMAFPLQSAHLLVIPPGRRNPTPVTQPTQQGWQQSKRKNKSMETQQVKKKKVLAESQQSPQQQDQQQSTYSKNKTANSPGKKKKKKKAKGGYSKQEI